MCEHLAEVDLGDSVVNIGEAAFYDDVLLMRLDIPTSVRKIGEHAFYHRRGMTLGVTPGSFAEWHARGIQPAIRVGEVENKMPHNCGRFLNRPYMRHFYLFIY